MHRVWMMTLTASALVFLSVWSGNAATLSGVVTDTGGKPISGAFVSAKQ